MNKIALFLKKAFFVDKKDIPLEIQNWVDNKIGRVIKYEIRQAQKIDITIPWHEADKVYYALFELEKNGNAKKTTMEFSRSGMESFSDKPIQGSGNIPSGYVMVEAHTHPKMAVIYTSDDAQQFVPLKSDNLSDEEILILYFAKALKPFARPIFKDNGLYENLVKKGYLLKNNSITVNGRNIVEEKKDYIYELTHGERAKYYNTHVELFSKLSDHSPFYGSWDFSSKMFKFNPSDRSWRLK